MPDETKVFIEQLSEKLQGIATQLDEALKAVQAGRGKLDNILSHQFNANEFVFVQEIGKQIQKGLDDKTLQVGTTIPICNQVLEKVKLIKKIKIGGVEVNNAILTSDDRSDNVKDQLADIAAKAAEMAKDNGGKTGKKKDLVQAIDNLRKALMEEMKKGLGVSKEVADEMGVPEDASPEQVEKAKKDYINKKLGEAGIADAWDLKEDSPEVAKVVTELGENLSAFPGELPKLEKRLFDKVVDDSKADETVARLVNFLGVDSAADLLAPDRRANLEPFRAGSRDDTSKNFLNAFIGDGKVTALNKIDEAIDSGDSAQHGDLDGFLNTAKLAGTNLGKWIAERYDNEIDDLIDHANNFVNTGAGEPLDVPKLLDLLKSLKSDTRVATNEYLRVDTVIRNKIKEIEKEDKKAAGKILTSFGDIGTATPEDGLDNKVKACADVIAKIIDKVDTKGSTVDVGGFDDLFG